MSKSSIKKILFFVAIFLIFNLLNCNQVRAEGSRDMCDYEENTYRGYLEDLNKTTCGILRQNAFEFYAEKGEVVKLGSSVYNSHDSKDIQVTYPDGTEHVFDVLSSGLGFIDTVAKERNGPYPERGGYTPLQFTVEQTGIYKVVFHSTSEIEKVKCTPKLVLEEFIDDQSNYVAAWDVTVEKDGVEQKGRLWCSYIPISAGNQNYNLTFRFYILTKDGYLYESNLKNIDPYGAIFYSNNRGLVDAKTNTSLYHTAKAVSNDFTELVGTVQVPLPQNGDTDLDIFHRIFLNPPSEGLPKSIPLSPTDVAHAENFKFVGITEGITTEQLGGFFSFDCDKLSSYHIEITTSAGTRIIGNTAVVGKNNIYWDGKDCNGDYVVNGTYKAVLKLKGGEYHFPFFDLEAAEHLQIKLLNPPYEYDGFNPNKIYYNNSSYSMSGVAVDLSGTGITDPVDASVDGIDSSTNPMKFTNSYGDQKVIDIWTYFNVEDLELEFDVQAEEDTYGYIRGLVFWDKNKDGSFSVSDMETGIKDAMIRLTNNSTGEQFITYTDSTGAYSQLVPLGRYKVEVVGYSGYTVTTNNRSQTVRIRSTDLQVQDVGLYLDLDLELQMEMTPLYYERNVNDTGVIKLELANNSSNEANNSKAVIKLPKNLIVTDVTGIDTYTIEEKEDYNELIIDLGTFAGNTIESVEIAVKANTPLYDNTEQFNISGEITSSEYELDLDNNVASIDYLIIVTKYDIVTKANDGGTVTGSDMEKLETVIKGEDATADIVITPNIGYEVVSITINGEEQLSGSSKSPITLDKFTNLQEDKEVVATFAKSAVDITASKVWEDFENRYGRRPESVTFVLSKNGNPVSEKIVTAEDGWTYTFEKWVEYDGETKNVYTIDEKATTDGELDSYTKSIDENIITNTLNPIPTSIQIKYIDVDTTEEILDSVTLESYAGEQYNIEQYIKQIDGYNLIERPEAIGEYDAESKIIEIYYSKRNDLSYTVNYLEKDTNNVLHLQKVVDQMTFKQTVKSESEVIDIDGYVFDSADKAELEITTGENVINLYYVKRNDLSYTVNYLEKDTNVVLHVQKVVSDVIFETTIDSSTEIIAIDGYNFDSVDKDSLVIGTSENIINIYYTKRNDLTYTVRYEEKDTGIVLHDPKIVTDATFGDVVNSENEVIPINGYVYDSVDKATLTIGIDVNEIVIYYTKVTGLSYTVNYLEKDTNNILRPAKVVSDMTFAQVINSEDEVIDIDGYNYFAVDKDALAISMDENIINIYYTKRDDLTYIVNYLEKDTDIVLHDQKVEENVTFDTVINSVNEIIDIDGYYYDSASVDSLRISTSENIIDIYYTKRNDLTYIVNYLERGTGEVLQEQKVVENVTFGTEINSADEIISITGYQCYSVEPSILTVGTGENVINVYYIKRSDLTYIVNYLEVGTNNVIYPTKIQENVTYKDEINCLNEIIDIDGYTYDSISNQKIIIDIGNNVINIYYTKRTDLSYIVNYLEKDTNNVLNTQKVQSGMTFDDVVDATQEIIDIDGYNYDSIDKEQLKISTDENVINIYYTKRTDLSYTVNYLEKNTDNVIHVAKVQGGMTFEDVVTSLDEVISIDGYNYDSVDKETLTIGTGENVINIYYTKRSNLAYTVNYLEKDTNKVLHDEKIQGGMTFEDVVTSLDEVISIDGYNYDSVDKETLTIGTGENVINIYYTKRNDLSYRVRYLEKDTNKVLHDEKIQGGITFGSVVESLPEAMYIDGYTFDSVDKPNITIGTGENVITVYYTKRTDLGYTVKYREKDTDKVLHDDKVYENIVFESVINSADEAIVINGYNYDSVDKETLTIGTGTNEIIVYYTKVDGLSYTVNYLEDGTNKAINPSKTVGNQVFESVIDSTDEIIAIDGYVYKSIDKTELTISTDENVINIYYTKRNDLSYIVNYLEKDTDNVIHVAKVQGGMTFEDVVISLDEVISIDGYNYDSVDKDSLTIGTGENVINIYYTKRTDLSYTVNYLEKDTDNVIHVAKVQGGMTFEDVVTSLDEVISIDGYNYDSVDKDSLTIGTGENVINIYYIKRNDLSYTVNYLEKDINKVISPKKVQDGMTFEDVVTSLDEVISIDGYNYDSVDKDSLTIGTGENVINIYYTKRTDLSYTVNYLEKDTNKEISPKKVQDGMTFEDVVTSLDEVISINGYNYDSVSKDSLTIGTGENVINIYYTKRNDLSYTVNYLEKETNKVVSPKKVQGGMTFEDVIISLDEVISINGYNYDSVDKETLTIGTGTNEIIVYYTKVDGLSYTVNYLEDGTNKPINPSKTVGNQVFESVIDSTGEIIAIDGYVYKSVDKDSLTIGTGENVINIYYTKRTDLSYTVNYLEKDTDNVIHAAKIQSGMIFEDVVISLDEVISIDGYDYDSASKDSLTIGTGENVINIYYTKRNDLSYTVNYLEKNTDNVIHVAKVQGGMTFEDVVTSLDEVISIDGYNYDSVDKETLTIGTGENVINVYYTKRTDLSYTVNYLEKDTDNVIHVAKVQGGMTFEDVVTSLDEVISIDGYNYDSVDKDSLTIGTGENVINIYYTKRNDLSYRVRYLEKNTKKVLHDEKIQGGMTFGSIVESLPEAMYIDGYTFDSVDKPNITIGTGENVITVYYTKRTDLGYTVKYREKDTDKVLHDDKVYENIVFESVINSADEAIVINGYNYDSVDKETLTIGTGTNEIIVYYTKVDGLSYTVNYLEDGTNKAINPSKTVGNQVFESVIDSTDEIIAIDGYVYKSIDKTELTISTDENVINIYYIKRNDLSYTVNYLENGTNKVISPKKVQGGMTFEDKVISTDEIITIDGYNYDSVDKDSLTIGTGENVINIYYTKRTDLSYTVNYLENDTDKVLHLQKVVDGVSFEDIIYSVDEIITIDGYNYNSVSKDSLTRGAN